MANNIVFEAWLSTESGTEFDPAKLPDASDWWKHTFKVPDQPSFDRVMTHILNSRGKGFEVKIHLEANRTPFRTKGIQFPIGNSPKGQWDSYSILGHGTGATLELINDKRSRDYLYAFGTLGWVKNLEISGLCINCRWTDDHGTSGYLPGYKTGGVYVRCITGLLDHVKVSNFGSKGNEAFVGAGREAFGLFLATGNFDQTTAAVQIRHCEVCDFHPEGGYCSGISLSTWHADASDQNLPRAMACPPVPLKEGFQRQQGCDNRPNPAAIVANNSIHDLPSGIGLGGCDVENTIYESNQVVRCKTGFNFDTVRTPPFDPMNLPTPPALKHPPFVCRNVIIRRNRIDQCHQGITAGAFGLSTAGFEAFTIQNNVVSNLTGWCKNPRFPRIHEDYPLYEECYGVQLTGGNASFVIQENVFSAVADDFECAEADPNADDNPLPALRNFLYKPEPSSGNTTNHYYPIRVIQGQDRFNRPHNGIFAAHTITNNTVLVLDSPPANADAMNKRVQVQRFRAFSDSVAAPPASA